MKLDISISRTPFLFLLAIFPVALLVVLIASVAFLPEASCADLAASLPEPTAQKLPIWRGFNLCDKFDRGWSNGPFKEEDFRLIHELGFNFVRLPMDYRTWIAGNDWTEFREDTLKEIDQAVEWGRKYGIHVCINFHRAPGYTVGKPPEAKLLWKDAEAQRVCALHWATFARRYKGIPNRQLSFNLFNEPADVDAQAYAAVVKKMLEVIRAEDPQRLVICDGNSYGTIPVPELLGLHVAESTRGYRPMELTHYKAEWVKQIIPASAPTWPSRAWGQVEDGEWLWKSAILPWQDLEKKGVGIMVQEFGCYNKTPHAVALAWMEDCLKNWKRASWGWALWNFRGSFGILDSQRDDVTYEDFQGHKLDRKMLELLQRY
jgi:endoglucanase